MNRKPMKRTAAPEKMERDREKSRIYRAANRERLLAEHRQRYRQKSQQPVVSAERLRTLLHYEPETGVFTYMVDRGRFKAGYVAGYRRPEDGRVHINVDGRLYRAHRLAWLYVHGVWPCGEIDHIDGNPSNNAFANLRDVTPTVNKQNKRRAQSGKKYSQLLGAQWCRQAGKWKSSIRVDGRIKHIGFFPSEMDAHVAYIEAKRRFHEGCTI